MSTLSFDLHKLGWKAFQDLVGCIFTEVMEQTFQQFADGPDEGRDGAYYGQWTPQVGEVLSGSFTIQCKHTSKINESLPEWVIDKELIKIERLSEKNLVDNYIFVTNHVLTVAKEQTARERFMVAGANRACVYGPEWINTKIAENPRLRRLVPRLYGLGDLTQIVTHQAYRQTLAVLRGDALDLKCFVPTEVYRKSAHALSTRGFVILLGEPGSGKSMIAKLLALSAADEWNLQTIMLSGPEELNNHFNPDDPGQFLLVDDAFGATQYDSIRAQEWNQRIPLLNAAINQGARVVFTSRDYIFNDAKDYLKGRLLEFFEDNEIIIQVEDISENERQMILYNHLKFGTQPRIFRKNVKPWLLEAAATRRFFPEVARQFANQRFTKGMSLNRKNVINFFEHPVTWLEGTLSKLGPAEKAALALVFIAGGRLPVPIPENETTSHTIKIMDASLGAVKTRLNTLNNALLKRTREDNGNEYWCFQHPIIRDAFAYLVGSNPEFIDIYLAGASGEKLIEEVTCGDLSLKGVKIIVPPEKYQIVIEKLKELGRNPTDYFDPVNDFLARKCGSGFLEKYFTECESMASLPGQIGILNVFDDSLRILSCLHVDCRLPEKIRLAAVKKIYKLADRDYSLEFTKEPIVHLLTAEEKNALIDQVKDVIFSNGSDLIQELADYWGSQEEEPSSIFRTYEETLSLIMDESEDEDECSKAEELMDEVSLTIQLMESERESSNSSSYNELANVRKMEYELAPSKQFSSGVEALKAKLGVRIKQNIFDDIDE